MGYAMPGAVMAVGVFVIQDVIKQTLGQSHLLGWINLTLLGMMIAYLARFLAVAYHPIESAQLRISTSIDEAARSLGTTLWQRLRFVRLPLLRPALISALIMVWIDVIKEMPITLMTRPFGWDGLSIRIFELTSEGLWQKAALPATCLVLLAALPVWWLARQKNND
jgi:iron(III) transport system permease protein